MSYSVKEIFYTLQGEGAQTGRAAVFCRFVGCNLWSGREEDRANAICKFCDTDFLGTDGPDGGKFATEAALADRIEQTWPSGSPSANKFVVFTGGEPLLQLDRRLIDAVHGVDGTPAHLAILLAGVVEGTMRRAIKPELHDEFLREVAKNAEAMRSDL